MKNGLILRALTLVILILCTLQFDYLKSNIPEFIVNKSTANQESLPVIATLSNGNFAIAWVSKTATNSNIYANVFSPTGAATSPSDILVSKINGSSGTNTDTYPNIAADTLGGFVVIYEDQNANTSNDIYVVYVDSTLVVGSPVKINSDVAKTLNADTFPSIVKLSDGTFLTCFSIDYTNAGKPDIRGNVIGPGPSLTPSPAIASGSNTLINDTSNTVTANCALAAVKTTIVSTWTTKGFNTADFDIAFKLYSNTNFGTGKTTSEAAINNTTDGGIQSMQAVAGYVYNNLGYFVVIWQDLSTLANGGGIYGRIFTDTGAATSSIFQVNAIGKSNNPMYPSVAVINQDGFAVSYQVIDGNTKLTNVYVQMFDFTGTRMGNHKLVNTIAGANIPKISGIKDGFVITYYNNPTSVNSWEIYSQIFYKDLGACKSFGINLTVNPVALKFNLDNSYWVFFRTLPQSGTLKSNSDVVLINTLYPINSITYSSLSSLAVDSFTYSTNSNSNEQSCTVSLTPCYPSCVSCTGVGTSSDHKCTACKNGYIFAPGSSNCYLPTEPSPGYFYDSKSNSFQKCYISCKSCLVNGDIKDNKCTDCAANYYPLKDKLNMCYPNNIMIPFYYFDGRVYIPCYKTCSTCTTLGNELTHYCTTCRDGYYPKSDDLSLCYKPDEDVPGYSFVPKSNTFIKCYNTCQTCYDIGDDKINKCKTCKGDNYFIDLNTNCVAKETEVLGYFFDKATNSFKKCHSMCETCSKVGTLKEPNCIKCAEGINDCVTGCTKYIYKETCVSLCPPLTITGFDTCLDCSADHYFYKNTCIEVCPDGTTPQDNQCIDCSSLNKLFYLGNCVDICPENFNPDEKGYCKEYYTIYDSK
jgi:hypothetical protein